MLFFGQSFLKNQKIMMVLLVLFLKMHLNYETSSFVSLFLMLLLRKPIGKDNQALTVVKSEKCLSSIHQL